MSLHLLLIKSSLTVCPFVTFQCVWSGPVAGDPRRGSQNFEEPKRKRLVRGNQQILHKVKDLLPNGR